jgi:hypothetical protein
MRLERQGRQSGPVGAKINPISRTKDRKAHFHGLKTPDTMPLPDTDQQFL